MAWTAFRAQNPALYSPYFHIDYTKTLGHLREDIYVVVASRAGSPLAFLPFQSQKAKGFARPAGAPMTDYHGFICRSDADFDPVSILKKTDLGVFHFDTLVDSNARLDAHILANEKCAVIDLSTGAEAWRDAQDSSYSRHMKSTRRRIRKCEDEVGARKFVFQSRDKAVFDTLIDWKRKQFSQTQKYDVLSVEWTLKLLQTLWENPQADLRTEMHVLYFGERIASIDLGLTDGVTFHSWIVAYDDEFSSYSPGTQLLEAVIDAAKDLGISRIDLGAGLDGYKRQYATEDVEVGSGFIPIKGPAAALSSLYASTETFGEKTSLGGVGKIPGKLRRRYSQIAACEDSFSGRAKAMLSAVKSQKAS